MIIAGYSIGATVGYNYIHGEIWNEYELFEEALAGSARRGLPRQEHPRRRLRLRALRAPRLRRLHLRRGDGAARVARGQEGPAALQAAVPGLLRPVRQADHDQQHRDLRRGALRSSRKGARLVPRAWASPTTAAPRSSRSSGHVSKPGNYEVKLGTPFAKLLEMAGGMRGGKKLKGVIPGRLVDAGAPRRRDDGDRHGLRLDRQGGLVPRLRRGDRHGRGHVHGEGGRAPRVLLLRGVVRPVHAVPRGHGLALPHHPPHRDRRGPARGPRPAARPRRQHPGPHHLRAGRRRGHAGARLREGLPRGVRAPHRPQALHGEAGRLQLARTRRTWEKMAAD